MKKYYIYNKQTKTIVAAYFSTEAAATKCLRAIRFGGDYEIRHTGGEQ